MDSHLSNDPSLMLNDDYLDDCSDDSDDQHQSKNAPLREQDRFLPIANIAKIMKRAIPENGKVIYLRNIHFFNWIYDFMVFLIKKI